MASYKDTFESHAFRANTFACGTWRGTGVAAAEITPFVLHVSAATGIVLPSEASTGVVLQSEASTGTVLAANS